jgi:uncharacterized protein YbbC (DUF1343 family)
MQPLLALCAALAAAPQQPLRLGIDVLLDERIELVRGKRLGLLTHAAGVDGGLVPSVDRLAADERVELARLFSPEHGIRGDVPAGDAVADARDHATGLPVISLYGAKRRPDAAALAGLDVLLVDLQDVGARCYTYVSSLGEAMAGCAEVGLPVIVLDRPNPRGGLDVDGPLREERWKSFIGWGPIPVAHGLTIGELARLYRRELGIDVPLEVVPMQGWTRGMTWEDTGLVWTQTSPHIPSARAAHVYAATAMAASCTTNVSDGVGSTAPFELLGAEFVDARALRLALEAAQLEGVRFQEHSWRPFYGAFAGRTLHGVRLVLDDPARFRPVRAALVFLTALRDLHPDALAWQTPEVVARHWGEERFLERLRAGDSAREIADGWSGGLERFARVREAVALYPGR